MIPESEFYKAVRQFATTAPSWEPAIRYFTKPDERWDLTLVAERVYGDREEYLAVMAAAGLDRFDQELTEREIVLPLPDRLALIKSRTGFKTAPPAPVR